MPDSQAFSISGGMLINSGISLFTLLSAVFFAGRMLAKVDAYEKRLEEIEEDHKKHSAFETDIVWIKLTLNEIKQKVDLNVDRIRKESSH